MEFTDERVAEAGEAILATGRTITGWALRTHLGGGKPERLIAVWRAHLGEAAPMNGPLPEEVLREARDGLRAALDDAAGAALDRVQQAAAEMLAMARARGEAAVIEATRDASAAVEVLEAELGRAAERAEATAARLGVAEEAAARTEQAEAMAADLRERLSVAMNALALSTERTSGPSCAPARPRDASVLPWDGSRRPRHG